VNERQATSSRPHAHNRKEKVCVWGFYSFETCQVIFSLSKKTVFLPCGGCAVWKKQHDHLYQQSVFSAGDVHFVSCPQGRCSYKQIVGIRSSKAWLEVCHRHRGDTEIYLSISTWRGNLETGFKG
jgi:hypothetical protein